MINLLKILDQNNMWLKDIFSKRKPNHLIIYVLYKSEESFLYKILSLLTYSVGPYKSIDKCIDGVKKFIKKHPEKLKQINITSFGSGKFLVQTTDDQQKVLELIKTLKPIIDENTSLMFTTCFSGVSYRKVVEMSEHLDGLEISAMLKSYSLNGEMVKCRCKEKNFSNNLISNLPKSRNGLIYDEKEIVNIVKRNENEEINWKTAGMAFEYNRLMEERGICYRDKQPYTLLKSIRNYLFNIQS